MLRSSSLVPGVGAQALLAGRQSYWLIMICLCTTWWILDIGADLGGWHCGAPGFHSSTCWRRLLLDIAK